LTAPLQCRCRSRARASLRTRHQGPSIMGFEDEVEQSFGRPCRVCDSRSKRKYDLTSSIVPRGTSFHRCLALVRLDGASPIDGSIGRWPDFPSAAADGSPVPFSGQGASSRSVIRGRFDGLGDFRKMWKQRAVLASPHAHAEYFAACRFLEQRRRHIRDAQRVAVRRVIEIADYGHVVGTMARKYQFWRALCSGLRSAVGRQRVSVSALFSNALDCASSVPILKP
jgi:hypothetical protein